MPAADRASGSALSASWRLILLAIPLLVGLGVDELSMNAVAIPRAKQIIRGLDYGAMQELAGEVMQAGDVDAVPARLAPAQAA